jgi:hypothetical protein
MRAAVQIDDVSPWLSELAVDLVDGTPVKNLTDKEAEP